MSTGNSKKSKKAVKDKPKGPYHVDRGVRLFANSNEHLVRHARLLAGRHVVDGDMGTVQDLLNFVVSALVFNPRLCDDLYRQGKELYPKIKDTPVHDIKAEVEKIGNVERN